MRTDEYIMKVTGGLRDQIAMSALQGLLAGLYAGNNSGFTVQGNVTAAYEYADAMLEAREKGGQIMANYQPWTPDEEETLIELCYTYKRIKDIARKMKRSEASIQSKIRSLREQGVQV